MSLKKKSVWKNSILNLFYKLVSMLFPLVSSAYVARILMPSGVGKVATVQNTVSYFLMFAVLGLPSYGIREISKTRENQRELNRTFSELITINAISTTVAILGYAMLIFAMEKDRNEWGLYIACGLQLIFNYFNIDWLYQGEEDYSYICKRSLAIKTLSLMLLYALVKEPSDIIPYASITSCALGLNYFFNIVYSRKYVSFSLKGLHLRSHLSPLLVLFLTIILSGIYSKVDMTMLGLFSTEEAAGLYTTAHKIVDIIIGLCASLTVVLLPRLSYSYAHDRTAFFQLLSQGMRVLFFVTIPLTAGLCLLAPQGMTILYGSSFKSGATALSILSLLIVVKSLGDLLCYQLTICTGNEKKRLPAYFCGAALNIGLNMILIPRMHQNGAALASLISEFVINGIQYGIMKKIVGFSLEWKALWQSVIATVCMACVVLLVKFFVKNMVIETVLSVVVGGGVYLAVNCFMKNELTISFASFIHRRLGEMTRK